jgi:hypothetical protein
LRVVGGLAGLNTKQKPGKTATTRNLPARFAFRQQEKQQNNTKRSHNQNTHTKNHRIAMDTETQRVIEKCTTKRN